jgi:thioesterase domain-containing protein
VPATVSEIADDYLAEIRRVQPYGPYLLGGFSFTGLVAIEIAQKLKRQGEEIGLLVLVDPTTSWSAPSSTAAKTTSNMAAGSFMSSVARQMRETGLRPMALATSIWKGLQWRIDGQRRRVTTPLKWALCRASLPVWSRLPYKPYPLRKFYFLQASLRVARRYEPEPYDGEVILFLSEELSGREMAWRQKVKGALRVHKFPGDHTELVREPNASTLAAVLRGYLTPGGRIAAPPAQF